VGGSGSGLYFSRERSTTMPTRAIPIRSGRPVPSHCVHPADCVVVSLWSLFPSPPVQMRCAGPDVEQAGTDAHRRIHRSVNRLADSRTERRSVGGTH
jgi:hypothetical protein